jgi:hypothetical protein
MNIENKIEISIIIVNYNLTESIRNLLNSVQRFTQGIQYEVIVVDNNSPDRSIEQLATEFPDFRFLFLKTNFGFGHGNNAGFASSVGEYLLLLNPDTYLIDNMPLGLYRFAKEHPDYGIIGPKMIFPDGRFQISTAKFPGIFKEIGDLSGLSIRTTRLANFIKFKLRKRKIVEVDYIFGSCMLIKTCLFKELKGFDEDFFLFTEEVDLCYRTRKKTGYKVAYYLNEKIVHMKSLITGKDMPLRMKLGYESKLKFFKKHYSSLRLFILKNVIITMFILKHFTLYRQKGEKSNYKNTYRSIIEHYYKAI